MGREVVGIEGFLVSRGDPAVAELAERQHGVVSTAQLHAAGVVQGAVDWRVRHGRLHRAHRGVYAVGHSRVAQRGRLWAAVLACGGVDAAALSHRTAAAVWDLSPAVGKARRHLAAKERLDGEAPGARQPHTRSPR